LPAKPDFKSRKDVSRGGTLAEDISKILKLREVMTVSTISLRLKYLREVMTQSRQSPFA
jgi:hypothetical protein